MKQEFRDPMGNLINPKHLHKEQKEAHLLVTRMTKRAQELNKKMKEYKEELLATCDRIYEDMLRKEQLKPRDNSRGTFSFTTTDKELKIEIRVSRSISFDSKIELAKEKIMMYADDIAKGSKNGVKEIIMEAFSTSSGRLDVKKVLALAKLKIDHPLWKDGIRLINEATDIQYSKRYISIQKKNAEGAYESIVLDLSNI